MRERKESGLPWIGPIPSDWDVVKFKHIFAPRNDRNPGDAIVLSLYREHGIVPKDSRDDNHNVTSLDTSKYRFVRVGDFVVNKMKAWQGSTAVSDYEGVVSPAYYVYEFRDKKTCRRFYHYLLRSRAYAQQFALLSGGIREGQWDLPADALYNIGIPVPSPDEQSRIADFLDDRCAKIDEAIARHQSLIEKLDEYRKAVVTDTVTGCTFNNNETQSLPKGWTRCRIKNLLAPSKEGIKIGPFGSSLTGKIIDMAKYKVYGQWNIVGKDFSAGKNYVSEETFNTLSSYIVVEGDVLISMMGTIGKCTIIPSGIQPGIMDSHVIKARLNEKVLPRFFEYEYDKDNSHYIYKQMLFNRTGSIMDGLNSTVVKNLYFILPTLSEQQRIVEYLDAKCAAIDSAKERHIQLIAKLEEYKKSLIYNAVTGKIEC